MKTVRTALVVGLGGIGQRHVRNLRALRGDDVEILAYRTRGLPTVVTDCLDVLPGAIVEEELGIRSFRRLEDALEFGPDVVFVTNPSSLHVPIATAAAHRGCHVFVEKPLSSSLHGIRELAALLEEKSLIGMVGYQLRFHPLLRRAKEVLDAGTLGPILAVRICVGEYLPGFHGYEDYRGMYAARNDLGGGVLLSQIHEFDYASWLFGRPRRVFAMGGHLSSLEVDVEDVASVLLDVGRGSRQVPVHIALDYVQRPPQRTCEVVADQGKLVLDLRAGTLSIFGAAGETIERHDLAGFERNQMFLDEMSRFLACVEEGMTPPVDIREGVASLRVALAARRSLSTGEAVGIPEGDEWTES